MTDFCPVYSYFFGYAGIAAAMALPAFAASYGTAKAASGIIGAGIQNPSLIMKGLLPVVMAGMLTIYGFVVALILIFNIPDASNRYSFVSSIFHLGAGLAVAFPCLASGYAIGSVGDTFMKGYRHQEKLFTPMLVILIFSEILGLFGVVVSIALITMSSSEPFRCAK